MELLRINDSKLKVMLTREDMKRYDLDGETIDYENKKARDTLWEILDEAKDKTGFDASGDKVLIQLYPSRDGGCELFVTKLGILPQLAEKTIARSNRVTMLSARRAIYRFPTLPDLLEASLALDGASALRTSEVYLGDDGGYYLVIEERTGKNSVSEFSRLLEYGDLMSPNALPYIQEHARPLIESDAIRLLSSLAPRRQRT